MDWTRDSGIPDCQLFISYYALHELKKTTEPGLQNLHNLSKLINQTEPGCVVVAFHDEKGYCLSMQMPLVRQTQCEALQAPEFDGVEMCILDTMSNQLCIGRIAP
jgi:hypothetical protein